MVFSVFKKVEPIRLAGRVLWYNPSVGMGVIQINGVSDHLPVYASDVESSGLHILTDGQKITFQISYVHKQYRATHLKTV